MSTSLFLALPTPLKIAAIVFGGFFWLGFKKMEHVEAVPVPVPAERAQDAARIIPAQPVAPAKKAAPAIKPIEITVNSDGSFNLAGKKLTSEQLGKELKATASVNPQHRVVIKADATTPYQMVVSALKLCKGSGLTNVSFASKPASP